MFVRISHQCLHLLSPCAAQYNFHTSKKFNPPPHPLPTPCPRPTAAAATIVPGLAQPHASCKARHPLGPARRRPGPQPLITHRSADVSPCRPASACRPAASGYRRPSLGRPLHAGPRRLQPTHTPTLGPTGHRPPLSDDTATVTFNFRQG
jgi:hypothetical protein